MGRPFGLLFDIFERRFSMWLLTQTGFFSAVRHVDEKDRLIVRARDKESLRGLSEAAKTQIQATTEGDGSA